MRAVARDMRDAGYRAMLVWVLAANPYRRFYERLRGRLLREQERDVGGAMLPVVAYGWDDVGVLMENG